MKKIQKISIVALAMFATACTGLETPVEPEIPGSEDVVVFSANVPTRTSIADDDKTVTWVAGDEVLFAWEGGSVSSQAANAGATTTFSVKVDAAAEEVYAVYPVSAFAGLENGEVTLDFASVLAGGEFSKADICIAKAVKDGDSWNTTLNFKNAACLLKVGVSSEATTGVQVQSVGEESIAGNLPVSFSADGDLVFGTPTDVVSVVDMTVSGKGNYYIPVFPGIELSDGFRVNCFEGETALVPFYYNGTFTTQRGQIIKLSEIESRLGQYYVTPEGAGTATGQSWENAMDVEKFKEFATNQENWQLLNGSVFHFSADEFSFGDDFLVFDFSDAEEYIEFTLEGTVTPTDTTTFLGRTNKEKDKAGVLWFNTDSYVIRNIKFTGTDGIDGSTAICVNENTKKVTFENCWFRGNSTEATGASIAVWCGAVLNIKDCSFSDNYGYGSAIVLTDYAKNSVLNITDSEIKSNIGNAILTQGKSVADVNATRVVFKYNESVEGDAGSAVYVQGEVTYNFTDCQFVGNTCDLGTNLGLGGIVAVDTDNAIIRFDGCLFENNDCYRDEEKNVPLGTIIHLHNKQATIYFNACEIKNNTSGVVAGCGGKGGSMIVNRGGAATIAMNNCSMHDNYTGRNNNEVPWIFFGHEGMYDSSLIDGAKFLLSNTSLIGCSQLKDGDSIKDLSGPVAFLYADAEYYLLNSIVCSTYESDNLPVALSCYAHKYESYYSKTSGVDDKVDWGSDEGSGHDYVASDLSGWNGAYLWNGTFSSGTNKDQFAPTAGVNAKIQEADADFYAWLEEIGALGKDINGNNRGTTSWPGCYQAN